MHAVLCWGSGFGLIHAWLADIRPAVAAGPGCWAGGPEPRGCAPRLPSSHLQGATSADTKTCGSEGKRRVLTQLPNQAGQHRLTVWAGQLILKSNRASTPGGAQPAIGRTHNVHGLGGGGHGGGGGAIGHGGSHGCGAGGNDKGWGAPGARQRRVRRHPGGTPAAQPVPAALIGPSIAQCGPRRRSARSPAFTTVCARCFSAWRGLGALPAARAAGRAATALVKARLAAVGAAARCTA